MACLFRSSPRSAYGAGDIERTGPSKSGAASEMNVVSDNPFALIRPYLSVNPASGCAFGQGCFIASH